MHVATARSPSAACSTSRAWLSASLPALAHDATMSIDVAVRRRADPSQWIRVVASTAITSA